MKEAIKGQNKLKLAVEKLEAELFKDYWPIKENNDYLQGFIVESSYDLIIKNCKVINTKRYGVVAP